MYYVYRRFQPLSGQRETGDRIAQHARLILERLSCRGGLFNERRVLLRHLIHFADRAVLPARCLHFARATRG